MSFDPETTLMTAERRKEYSLMRLAEIELERVKLDQELRKWCIEQTESHGCSESRISQAASLYEWILGKPKADPEAYLKKLKADAA